LAAWTKLPLALVLYVPLLVLLLRGVPLIILTLLRLHPALLHRLMLLSPLLLLLLLVIKLLGSPLSHQLRRNRSTCSSLVRVRSSAALAAEWLLLDLLTSLHRYLLLLQLSALLLGKLGRIILCLTLLAWLLAFALHLLRLGSRHG
jgi:hypothetical protein